MQGTLNGRFPAFMFAFMTWTDRQRQLLGTQSLGGLTRFEGPFLRLVASRDALKPTLLLRQAVDCGVLHDHLFVSSPTEQTALKRDKRKEKGAKILHVREFLLSSPLENQKRLTSVFKVSYPNSAFCGKEANPTYPRP